MAKAAKPGAKKPAKQHHNVGDTITLWLVNMGGNDRREYIYASVYEPSIDANGKPNLSGDGHAHLCSTAVKLLLGASSFPAGVAAIKVKLTVSEMSAAMRPEPQPLKWVEIGK
jgi:hypothetical protein